jgi:hypothetical protein
MYFNNTTEEFQNATIDEFQTEALNIHSQDVKFIAVLPRTYGGIKFKLMLFQHPTALMIPCKIAFNCSRIFNGLSYLVKKICWTCKTPASKLCSACNAAVYCSKECQATHFRTHKEFCKMVKTCSPRIAESSEDLQMKDWLV